MLDSPMFGGLHHLAMTEDLLDQAAQPEHSMNRKFKLQQAEQHTRLAEALLRLGIVTDNHARLYRERARDEADAGETA